MALQIGAAGFPDPVSDAQSTFRTLMNALAHPALAHDFTPRAHPCGPLGREATAILLTLADQDTPVWLDDELAQSEDLRSFIAFHCGAPIVAAHGAAAFAFFSDARAVPPFARFHQGDHDYPDRSTTLVVQVEDIADNGLAFSGPGLRQMRCFGFQPGLAEFGREWPTNAARFPLGLDAFFVAPSKVTALPRSLRIVSE